MKTGLFSAAVIAALAVAGVASAQTVTGTVNITGTVDSKCSVNGPGGPSAFSDTWNLGELADGDGTLTSIPPQSTSGDGIQITCTSPPTVSIFAQPIHNPTGIPGPGYADTVYYVAYADFDTVSGIETISDAAGGPGGSTPTPLSTYLDNAPDNIVIRANTFTTPGANDVLTAGNYSGWISVTITP